MSYSLDFRKHVFKAKEEEKLSLSETSRRFKVPYRTLQRWQKRIDPITKRNKPATKIDVDPLAEKMPSWSPYAFGFNSPINFVDPDGRFPILINGRVGKDSERASWTYWHKSVRETIKSRTGYYHSQFKYVDGDKGMWAGGRMRAGVA